MSPLRARAWEPGQDWERSPGGLYLPPGAAPKPRPIGVDLFAGAGGFSLGFHEAGWHVAAASEWDVDAVMTYLCNLGGLDTRMVFMEDADEARWEKALERQARRHMRNGSPPPEPGSGWISTRPGEPACEVFYLGDVRQLTGARILEDLGCEVDCIVGGPPCQGFSRSGMRNVMDPRNSLVFEFMRLVVEVRPKAFCMENVPGIASMVTPEGVPVIDAICRVAEDGGFGTYEAIKRGLLASSGAGAALRTAPVRHTKDPEGNGSRGMALDGRDRLADPEADDQQLSLLGAA